MAGLFQRLPGGFQKKFGVFSSCGYRDLGLLGERFHVIEPERWNKMFSLQVSSAATPVSLESLAREKMSQNLITYGVSQSSRPTLVKFQTIRLSVLAAVASSAQGQSSN